MRIKSYVKYSVIIAVLLIAAAPAYARYSVNKLEHYLAISVGAAEANNAALSTPAFNPKAGGAGNLTVAYEMRVKNFTIGIGAEAQYQYTHDYWSDFSDIFDRVDKNGESVKYEYVYSSWNNYSHDWRLTCPIYVGYQAGDYFYALLGAKVSIPMSSTYKAQADMFTQGTYDWSIEPVQTTEGNDFTAFGYYPQKNFSTKDRYQECLWAAASVELGSYIPLKEEIKKVRMRMGLYVDYAWRLGKNETKPLVQYSEPIVLNNVLNTDRLKSNPNNVEVGVRFTVLFDIHTTIKHCMCY